MFCFFVFFLANKKADFRELTFSVMTLLFFSAVPPAKFFFVLAFSSPQFNWFGKRFASRWKSYPEFTGLFDVMS